MKITLYTAVNTMWYFARSIEEGFLFPYRYKIFEKKNDYVYKVLEMEVMPDHVYHLIDLNHKRGVYYVVNRIKCYTSHILREEFPELKRKLPTMWTHSKFISSVGAVIFKVVKKYIGSRKGYDLNIQHKTQQGFLR